MTPGRPATGPHRSLEWATAGPNETVVQLLKLNELWALHRPADTEEDAMAVVEETS
jgi:hypothetical protein